MRLDELLLERFPQPSEKRTLPNTAIFQRMAYDLLSYLAYNIRINAPKENSLYGIFTASQLGSARLSDLVKMKFYRSRLIDKKIRNFIKEKGDLEIMFSNSDRELNPSFGGHYSPSKNEILIRMNADVFGSIISALREHEPLFLNSDHFKDKLAIMVHEITHAYDDWLSKGKYQSNARSQEANRSALAARRNPNNKELQDKKWKDYFVDPIEINARFFETVSNMRGLSNMTWDQAVRSFTYEIGSWKEIPKDEQRKLIKRFARVWINEQRQPQKNYVEDVNKLAAKIKNINGGIYIRYYSSSQSILIDIGMNKTLPRDVVDTCIKFCDVRNITIATDAPFKPDLKALGFVANKGRTKRYNLSWSTTCYRDPKRLRR